MRVISEPAAAGGWAWTLNGAFTHQGGEQPSAFIDAWEPPHRLSVPADMCDELRVLAERAEDVEHTGSASYYYAEPPRRLRDELADRCEQANAYWWRLDVDSWHFKLKRYLPGERHEPHQDLLPMTPTRKIAAVVQLSEPDDYDGGNLVAHLGPERAAVPRARGTLAVFAGWTVHEVTEITRGERWSLCINGLGPGLR